MESKHSILHDETGPLVPMPKKAQNETSLEKQTVAKVQELLSSVSEEGRCELYQILKTGNRGSPLASVLEDIKLKKLLYDEQERDCETKESPLNSGLLVIVSEVISDKYRYLLIKALETDVAIDKWREKTLLRGSPGKLSTELHDAVTKRGRDEEEDY